MGKRAWAARVDSVTSPTWMRIEMDPVALGFAVLVTILTALPCGLTSAFFAARADLNTMLKEG